MRFAYFRSLLGRQTTDHSSSEKVRLDHSSEHFDLAQPIRSAILSFMAGVRYWARSRLADRGLDRAYPTLPRQQG
jgi:hypothetical protein